MKNVIILEGPDGGGKTTLAKTIENLYEQHSKKVLHTKHHEFKGETQIWRHFFDSLLPAYRNDCDVLLDRSWYSEPIYGKVFRDGYNRLEHWQLRIINHLLGICSVSVVWCLPPLDTCLHTFNNRREQEMLDNDKQLAQVYKLYEDKACLAVDMDSDVHHIYDFTKSNALEEVIKHVKV